MSVSIVEIFTGDKAMQLSNSAAARTWLLPIADTSTVGGSPGTDWTKIILAAHLTFDGKVNNAIDNVGDPFFYLGGCSGVNQILGASAPLLFYGGRFGGGTWTFASGPPGTYTNGQAQVQFQKNVNGVITTSGFAGSFQNRYSADPANFRGVVAIQLEKTGGNIAIRAGGQGNATTYPDITETKFRQFFDLSDISDIATWDSNYGGAINSTTLSDVQSVPNGFIDTFNMYYDKSAVTCIVNAVGFKKVS